jgi:aminopeptidase N
VASGKGEEFLTSHYFEAKNMTEELHGLELYLKSGVSLDHESIQRFYKKWGQDSLTMIKWFAAIASFSPAKDVLRRIEILEKDELFLNKVPNYLRALYASFARLNLASFHAVDGSGYDFFASRIIQVDKFNPQIAARMATNFSQLNKLQSEQKLKMKYSLQKILEAAPSRDTLEVINKYLAQ